MSSRATTARKNAPSSRRYGRQLETRFSATHTEYLAAEDRGLRIAVWAKDVDDREGHEQSFLDEVREFHTTGSFRNADELADDVERRLRRIAAEDLAPWVKTDDVVFRAHRVAESAGRIRVQGRVRDPEVLHRLESLQGDRWGRGYEGLFTWAGRSRPSLLDGLEVTTTAGKGADLTLELSVLESRRDGLQEMSVSDGGRTYSAQDLTELGLRATLFGERAPISDFSQHFASVPDPFEPLRGVVVSDEIIRPLAHVLLTEALVGTGKASRITRFRLGPPVAGRRRFELAWRAPERFNTAPEERVVEGDLTL